MKKIILGFSFLSLLILFGCKTGETTDELVIKYPNYDIKENGILYTDVKEGTGEEIVDGDWAVVHYTGTLENGKVFDTSKREGREPFMFKLGDGTVIEGWDEGVKGMKAGGIRKLVVSSNQAYGRQGSGSNIPPNATLLFEIELLEIK